MSDRSRRGLSRGDRRRNERLTALREIVTRETAVISFDLAADKQAVAVCAPDSRVLTQRTVAAKAWRRGQAVAWGIERACEAGFSSVVVACEPTGHRWRVLDQLAAEQGVRLVCVQPLLVRRARQGEDFTRNKNDDTDAVIIARLVGELRCYLPERAEPVWARLRHLGARRARLVVDAGAARQQVRDLLECAWPVVLEAAAHPLVTKSWLAAVTVALERVGEGGDLSVIRRWGWPRFAAAVRRELGATRCYSAIVRAVFDAAVAPAAAGLGVAAQRAGALERARFALADLAHARREITVVEAGMLTVLDHLGVSELAASIPGVSPVQVAAILAESGDPHRFTSARALVKHAGLCPRANESGTYAGHTGISGRGRPGLRLAAWRAVFTALQHNPVLAARYQLLTGRAQHPLTDTQARVAVAASLLRQLHAMILTGSPWDAATAAGLDRGDPTTGAAAA